MCCLIYSLFHVKIGPIVKSFRFLFLAYAFIFASRSVFLQFLCINIMDWAEHFCPEWPKASWSAYQAT